MLGQAVSMLIPQVVGFKLSGELPEGSTATDLVLTVTQMLRERGVVGKFVEFHGPGLPNLPLADRATIGNMSPEMGATCAIFPVDAETLRYLEFSGRPAERVELVEAYAASRASSTTRARRRRRTRTRSSSTWAMWSPRSPARSGPRTACRCPAPPRTSERSSRSSWAELPTRSTRAGTSRPRSASRQATRPAGPPAESRRSRCAHTRAMQAAPPLPAASKRRGFGHGSVVIAAITSCTNTSNPSVMLGAGLLAKKAVEAGLERMPWVKTSLAPGSKVVTDYLERAGLIEPLSRLGFDLVGYGCTTCIGNSGPLPEEISKEIEERDLVVASVLSGNRNFEGRIHPEVKMNYLASPPLCVAYALAGRMDVDIVERAAPGRRLPARHLAEPGGGQRRHRVGDRVRHVPQELRRGVRGRRELERRSRSRRGTATTGTTPRPT